eukprot:CAMPEP_0119543450 /NCGR_PEP_ID=MMETSP1344-20130328/54124_1 /TAXON_ID=236787 /ORGANISM="Florenciella parvula, Strain CCMP2471" /LENGTH=93 /DNA_ID=CAMNT_0007587733 /DNA_START=26 /DNA_END=306 /DNA_ORIENTATION=-
MTAFEQQFEDMEVITDTISDTMVIREQQHAAFTMPPRRAAAPYRLVMPLAASSHVHARTPTVKNTSTSSATPQEDVDSLIQKVADENQLELGS